MTGPKLSSPIEPAPDTKFEAELQGQDPKPSKPTLAVRRIFAVLVMSAMRRSFLMSFRVIDQSIKAGVLGQLTRTQRGQKGAAVSGFW